MPTFLRTPKMSSALAARVEASVRKQASRDGGADRRLVALFRLVIVGGLVAAAVALFVTRRHAEQDLETSRAALLEVLRTQRARLSGRDMQTAERALAFLLRAADRYEGDIGVSGIKAPEDLSALLSQPMLYVRAPLEAFKNEAAITLASQLSFNDAFVFCLLESPETRREGALLERVRAAQAASTHSRERMAHVHRFFDAKVGIPFLEPGFRARVKEAGTTAEMTRLEHEVKQAHLEEVVSAAKTRYLLFVMDEPSPPGGVTELDGERAHDARVGFVNLDDARVVFRVRKRLDPSGFSDRGRTNHATGLDACVLSLDVRLALSGPQ
jgi:hypothetical protein